MGFVDEYGYKLINDEQKIRITLSIHAEAIITEDMEIFGIEKITSFINTVFANYKTEAKSSVCLYLQQRQLELDRVFIGTNLDATSKKNAINQILAVEEEYMKKRISEYSKKEGKSKLYHINDSNVKYLLEDCDENQYYSRPGLYIRAVIEEYCSLPFIERERIYRKDIYDIVKRACLEKRILKIKANYHGTDQVFHVYPYDILPDPLHTQSYLVCYSRKENESDKDMVIASFSMARLALPTMLTKTFHLNAEERSQIATRLSESSPAYLLGTSEEIKVRLTQKGKQSYHSRLFSRPEKTKYDSSEDVYIFNCSHQQIYNYFFSFGADVEIISPESLRNRFKNTLSKALENYNC